MVGNETKANIYPDVQNAMNAASAAAVASFGLPIMGILYSQAGRNFISSSLPVPMLLSMARRDSVGRKDDPALHRNRPLSTAHVREISEYLRTEPRYLVPPIMLNSAVRLQTFIVEAPVPTKLCYFVLPPEEYLYVTDGQHRLEAIRQALQETPRMRDDSVGVTIVEEADIDKVHQDFYDAAQAAPLAKALLVEFDGREPLNALTRHVGANALILHGRVEKIGSVGKNSLMLFTTNQVKQAIYQLLVGDWSLYASAIQKQAQQILEPAQELWQERVMNFLDEFALCNLQWKQVIDNPLEAGTSVDIPRLRQNYLHFSGGGLLVLGGVGHAILDDGGSDSTLTDRQKGLISSLADIDWSRMGELWQGYLVGPQGNIAPHKSHIALAVAKVKEVLQLPRTEKELKLLNRTRQLEEEVPTAAAMM